MIKKYFHDGLLQLAILLSLLRTDLNNYLNLQLHNTHTEIHEIILGPTSAYTQTNFHSHHWNSDIGFSHPKNIENIGIGPESILEELHALGGFAHSIPHDTTSIAAWLVNQPLPGHLAQDDNEDQSDSAVDSQPTATPSNEEENNSAEAESPLNEDDSFSQAQAQISHSGELTKEDMDLIEVLWRQDMDLGVSREMYDAALRRELEKEKEHAEKKLESEQPSISQKKEDGSGHAYLVDSETGELTPAPPGTSGPNVVYLMPEELAQQQSKGQNGEPDESLSSLEEAMRLLEQQVSQGPPASQPAAVAPVPLVLIDQQYQALLNNAQSNGLTSGQGTQPYPTTSGQPQLMRGSSLEQTLQEMAELLASSNSSLCDVTPDYDTYPIVSATNNSYDDNSTPLLQNTTMAPPADYYTNLTQPLTMPTWEDLLDLEDMQMDSLGPEPNPLVADESLPFDAGLPSLDTEQLFENLAGLSSGSTTSACNLNLTGATFQPVDNPHINAQLWDNLNGMQGMSADVLEAHGITRPSDTTNSTQQSDSSPSMGSCSSVASDHGYFSSGGFLDQLLNQNDDAFEEMEFSDEEVKPRRVADDASSDSAVSSMGSIASPNHASYQDLNDTGSTFSDQLPMFDGVEGATGGYEDLPGKPLTKVQRFRDLEYPQSNMDATMEPLRGEGPSYSLANKKHVKHNHTYPLQPGQKPRERKSDKRDEMKISMTRDTRRAKNLKIPFTVEEIIHSSVERFNEMMQQGGLTDPQLQLIRDIRRRGKNKVAAQNCRKRKLDVISTLDDEVNGLRGDQDRLSRQLGSMNKEVEDVKSKMGQLYSEIFRSLRDDSGRPYDPDQYLLEQNDDGDVFLVPRNSTEGRPRKAGKKHKGKRSK